MWLFPCKQQQKLLLKMQRTTNCCANCTVSATDLSSKAYDGQDYVLWAILHLRLVVLAAEVRGTSISALNEAPQRCSWASKKGLWCKTAVHTQRSLFEAQSSNVLTGHFQYECDTCRADACILSITKMWQSFLTVNPSTSTKLLDGQCYRQRHGLLSSIECTCQSKRLNIET